GRGGAWSGSRPGADQDAARAVQVERFATQPAVVSDIDEAGRAHHFAQDVRQVQTDRTVALDAAAVGQQEGPAPQQSAGGEIGPGLAQDDRLALLAGQAADEAALEIAQDARHVLIVEGESPAGPQ